VPDKILENKELKSITTFGVSASARYFTVVQNENDFLNSAKFLKDHKLPHLILGGGSNLLFTQNFPGLVIKNEIKGINIISEDDDEVIVSVGSGEVWHDLVLWAVNKGFGGIENLSLIPGSCGAAPIQNIGAYGVEQRELKGEVFITGITLRLSKNPVVNTSYGAITSQLKLMKIDVANATPKDVSSAVIAIRQSKLPDPAVLGNAGSFFKNPLVASSFFEELKKRWPEIIGYPANENETKLAAGWLIEHCGWKGKKIGEVGSHKDQALVIVNYGSATGKDVYDLAMSIQKSVMEKFGVAIEPEVNIL
jgi:UDP-N-acetylmuramate dehydrogenase